MNKKQKKTLCRIISAVLLFIVAVLASVEGWGKLIVFMIPYLVIGYDVLKKAFKGMINGQVFDENFLMAIATVGALILGEYPEAVAVMLFYQIGELFESCAVDKSRKNIADLMDIAPDYANLEVSRGKFEKVDPEEVEPGSIIIIKPGERIPIDGEVVEGTSVLNTSALTGESVPKDVAPGDSVISGCINMTGLLRVRTVKEFGESTVSKIIELVEESSMKKSRSENFITRFAKYYTPAVCISAVLLAVLPPLASIWFFSCAPMWEVWAIRALTFLVISCPCALVISVPLSFFGGIGGASARGILIKGSNYLESLAKAKYIVMDKTGTLTKGEFEVVEIASKTFGEDELLKYAAHAELYSDHPISRCIKDSYKGVLEPWLVSEETEISGMGVKAIYEGKTVVAGNAKLMTSIGIKPPVVNDHGTAVYVAVDDIYSGYILVADTIKPGSKNAVDSLKGLGVKEITLLTGDLKSAALDIAEKLGIDDVKYELLPEEKVAEVEQILERKQEKEQLVFVGDGINDAPVLMRADIGIAMGAMGSDAAIEAADIILMDDDPEKISTAIRISKKTLSIVYQNIVLALGVKGVCLILGALGAAGMWAAIFADVGVMVIAVMNAMRALDTRRLK